DQPSAAAEQEARELPVGEPMEVSARPGEEDEGRRAEVRDPAGEEDRRLGAARGDAGEDSHVIDRHEDHGGAAEEIDRGDARGGVLLDQRPCRKSSTALLKRLGWSTNVMWPESGRMTSFEPEMHLCMSSAIEGSDSSWSPAVMSVGTLSEGRRSAYST